jgi:hypothetical protein
MTDFDIKTKGELIALCKERGIKGHSQIGVTKEKIIQLLKGEIEYKDPRTKGNWSEFRKHSFETSLKKRQLKNNMFDYLTKNNPHIITKYAGDQDELKTISYGTMIHYKWRCENSDCSNIFEARPSDVFRNDEKRPQIKYCSTCKEKNRMEQGIKLQKYMLERNGSIQTKMPNIIDVWCEDNKFKPDELTNRSHKQVKLKCPNKSAKHPNYEIRVYNIQESNCFSCPKCSVKTSRAEMRIYSELKYTFKVVRWQHKIEGREADITIEDLKLVIEVDGFPWHMNKTEKDLLKNNLFENNGYSVLRIRDLKLGKISCNYITCDLSDLSLTEYNKIIEWINIKFHCNVQVFTEWKNVEYFREVQASVLSVPYDESLEYLFPESKELWDYEKNYPLVPTNVKPGSNIQVWLKCKNGHSYERGVHSTFRSRIKDKTNLIIQCPQCSTNNRKNKRPITINGIKYKSIMDCCRNLKFNKDKIYNRIRQHNKDVCDINVIEEYILKIINQ